jgi:hypothetical protein
MITFVLNITPQIQDYAEAPLHPRRTKTSFSVTGTRDVNKYFEKQVFLTLCEKYYKVRPTGLSVKLDMRTNVP